METINDFGTRRLQLYLEQLRKQLTRQNSKGEILEMRRFSISALHVPDHILCAYARDERRPKRNTQA